MSRHGTERLPPRLAVLVATLAGAMCIVSAATNTRPVIGLLDQPSLSGGTCNLLPYGRKYIVASYVKLIESTGAQVIPIPYDASPECLTALFNSINGLVLPGGDASMWVEGLAVDLVPPRILCIVFTAVWCGCYWHELAFIATSCSSYCRDSRDVL